jgi:type I restriction enzyme R subunit
LRLQNILASFDDFSGNELLSERQRQDYQSVYLDLYAEFRREQAAERESIIDDVVFEIELIKQVEINVDYILMLVEKHRQSRVGEDDSEVRATICRAVDASPTLRNKRDLIEQFVDSVSVHGNLDDQWRSYIEAKRVEELDRIIEEESLRAEPTRAFIASAFRDGSVQTAGTAVTSILLPFSRFSISDGYGDKKRMVLMKLEAFFERFFGLGTN